MKKKTVEKTQVQDSLVALNTSEAKNTLFLLLERNQINLLRATTVISAVQLFSSSATSVLPFTPSMVAHSETETSDRYGHRGRPLLVLD